MAAAPSAVVIVPVREGNLMCYPVEGELGMLTRTLQQENPARWLHTTFTAA